MTLGVYVLAAAAVFSDAAGTMPRGLKWLVGDAHAAT